MPLSYEIVLLEVKKSKSKSEQACHSDEINHVYAEHMRLDGKLTGGLEQVITECAAM